MNHNHQNKNHQSETSKTTLENLLNLLRRKQPTSSSEKNRYAVSLIDGYNKSQFISEIFKWIIGGILCRIDDLNLYHHAFGRVISKNAFFEELGMPPSTAQSRIMLWRFYITKHKLSLTDVKDADIYKLSRALRYLQNRDIDEVRRIVALAERGKISRIDFLREIGAIQ